MTTATSAYPAPRHGLPTAAAGTSRSAVRRRGQACDQYRADALRAARFKLIADD